MNGRTICDRCGAWSAVYQPFVMCRSCCSTTCPKCDVPNRRDDECGLTTCRACVAEDAAQLTRSLHPTMERALLPVLRGPRIWS